MNTPQNIKELISAVRCLISLAPGPPVDPEQAIAIVHGCHNHLVSLRDTISQLERLEQTLVDTLDRFQPLTRPTPSSESRPTAS